MTKKELRQQIKQEQKNLAEEIKRGKFLRKPRNWSSMTPKEKRIYIYTYSDYGSNHSAFNNYLVDAMSENYRHIHIVYCSFFNNTPYDKIENPRKDHKPNTSILNSIRKSWESQLDEEALCCSA